MVKGLVLLLAAATAGAAELPLPPDRLRCEYLENPAGVDVRAPRFAWVPQHQGRNQRQTAYQIVVTSDSKPFWDSRRVPSEDSTQVVYGGPALQSDRSYGWRVRYWDSAGRASDYSAEARFATGLLDQSDWQGSWIGGGNELRHAFELDSAPTRATAYFCGLGYGDLWLNGGRAGDAVLEPAWTTYTRRALYSTVDVTALLQPGRNDIRVYLGKGRAGFRALRMELRVRTGSGREYRIASGPEWQARDGAILSDDVYDGEVYDATKEEGEWRAAKTVAAPAPRLSSAMLPPIRVTRGLTARAVSNPRPGVYVFDFGQVFSGWTKLRLAGPRGTRVRLRHAELLYADGGINTENLREAKAQDTYVLRGGGHEIYEPRFTYHGFRYVELTGFPGVPGLDALEGRVVHSAVAPAGAFSCSNELLNKLHGAIRWSQQTNLHGIPTDNNQRDERLGWLGDAHVTMEEASLNFDMAAFYTKFLRDIADAQLESGAVPDTVPFASGNAEGDPAWGSAYPLLCWHLYRCYGDRRVVEEHYAGVKRFVQYLNGQAGSGLLASGRYGDWVALEPTPPAMVANFYYILDLEILSKMAALLGRTEEAGAYSERGERLKGLFREAYRNIKSQTARVLMLRLRLGNEETMRGLTDDILIQRDMHLATGIIGTKYLLPALFEGGRGDVAYELLRQRSYPSWGYMLDNGATGLWEVWQKRTGRRMNSQNQPMLGSADAWLYAGIAGIRMDDEVPAYRKILVVPGVLGDLDHAGASLETLAGQVSVRWNRLRAERRLFLELTVPVGSVASVQLPDFNWGGLRVSEGGREIAVRHEQRQVRWETGSGRYLFQMEGER
jgi:alpha-L-rhamnosidase